MTNGRAVRRGALVTIALLAAAISTGCADSHPQNKAAGAERTLAADKSLHDRLPAEVRARGTLRVVTDASYPPASSFGKDGRTIIGFEPDLGRLLGQVLGIRVQFANRTFATLPSLLGSGRADLIMSAMTDTREREKNLDFVDYYSAGSSIVVRRGNPSAVTDLSSLCGLNVAVEKGTVQQDLLTREAARCENKPMHLLLATTNDDALLLVRTGRAAAVPMDFPTAEVLTTDERTSDLYQLASTAQYEPGPYGMGVAKTRTDLRDAVRGALTVLIRNGSYAQVLRRWHVESGAVRAAQVNAASSTG